MRTLAQKNAENAKEESEALATPILDASTENGAHTPPDLSELFNRDPHELTDTDLDHIIAGLRKERKTWLMNLSPTGTKKKAAAKKPAVQLDLSSLAIKAK